MSGRWLSIIKDMRVIYPGFLHYFGASALLVHVQESDAEAVLVYSGSIEMQPCALCRSPG